MKDPMVDEALSKPELSTWHSLKSGDTDFLGNHLGVEWEKDIGEQLKSFREFEARMSNCTFNGHTTV